MSDDNDLLCGCNVIHEDAVKRAMREMAKDETLGDMAEFYKVFCDYTRLKIINALLISEMCVCDIAAVVGMNQSGISHHLKMLRSARVIKSRREGKMVYYSLCDGHIDSVFSQGLTHVKE